MAKSISSGDFLSEEDLLNHIKIYAGPGAGKTHFLVENVKRLVSTNELIKKSTNRKILCITYTNKAVNEIVHRLQGFNDYVESYTIHGFIIEHIIKPFQSDLLRLMEEDFNIKVSNSKMITSQIEGLCLLHEVDKQFVYNYINEENNTQHTYDYSKKSMSDVQVDIKAFIDSLRNDGILNFSLNKPNRIAQEDLVPIKKYIWSEARKLTHDEILYFGFRIIQTNPVALYVLRVKFPFIFVDEFQDTNPLQTQIIKLIGEESTKIIVVGDIAQSIYSFQGAKISDFIEFKIDGNIKELAINGNRRSTVNIVNICNFFRQSDSSIWQSSERKYKEKIGNELKSSKIKFLMGDSNKVMGIIDSVLDEGGVILTRGWADAFNFIQNIKENQTRVLRKIYNSYYNSPIQLRNDIREHSRIAWVRAFKFIFTLWEGFREKSFADIIIAFKMYFTLEHSKITVNDIFLIRELSEEVFNGVTSNSFTVDIIEKFNKIISQSRFLKLNHILDDGSFKIALFNEYDQENLIENIKLLEWETSYRLFNEVFSEDSKYMTVHQAKGLEWEKVIVSVNPNSFDKRDGVSLEKMFKFPQITNESASHEFTRLYYVACSRAKDELYIHLEDINLKQIIEDSLKKFHEEKNIEIRYEFIF